MASRRQGPTRAQLRCLELAVEGFSYPQIAQHLGRSESTVRKHFTEGCENLQTDRMHLAEALKLYQRAQSGIFEIGIGDVVNYCNETATVTNISLRNFTATIRMKHSRGYQTVMLTALQVVIPKAEFIVTSR